MLAPTELIRETTSWLRYFATGIVLAVVVVRMRQAGDEAEMAES